MDVQKLNLRPLADDEQQLTFTVQGTKRELDLVVACVKALAAPAPERDDEDDAANAAAIDHVTAALGPIVARFGDELDHMPIAMGLGLMAAHEVMHDTGDPEDLRRVADAAWERTVLIHQQNCH